MKYSFLYCQKNPNNIGIIMFCSYMWDRTLRPRIKVFLFNDLVKQMSFIISSSLWILYFLYIAQQCKYWVCR